jgi:hypothetical protein
MPQHAQERNEQQGRLGVTTGTPARPSRQRRRTAPMGVLHGQVAQREQVQPAHERERIEMQSRMPLYPSPVICWGRDRRLRITESRQHRG